MHVVPIQWNHHILCSILINCRNLCALTHIGKMSRYTRFDACWQNVVIYALWRILAKCRDLRTLPGTKCWLPGTFNYSAPLLIDIQQKYAHAVGTHRRGIEEIWVHFVWKKICKKLWPKCPSRETSQEKANGAVQMQNLSCNFQNKGVWSKTWKSRHRQKVKVWIMCI